MCARINRLEPKKKYRTTTKKQASHSPYSCGQQESSWVDPSTDSRPWSSCPWRHSPGSHTPAPPSPWLLRHGRPCCAARRHTTRPTLWSCCQLSLRLAFPWTVWSGSSPCGSRRRLDKARDPPSFTACSFIQSSSFIILNVIIVIVIEYNLGIMLLEI